MNKYASILPPPLGYRKNIPLYYPKTEAEIKADSYEIYNPNVIRSCRNFYEGDYGTSLLEEVKQNIPSNSVKTMVELGCGSGYLIGNLASAFPEATCIGLDYSYQMLKIGAQIFKNKKEAISKLTGFQNGMRDLEINNLNLPNLTFGLSDACLTPIPDNSIDFCFSCFLFDRVGDPSKLIEEIKRICKAGAIIQIISPFNYLKMKSWKDWHPIENVVTKIEEEGLKLLSAKHFTLSEYLDIRRNRVVWEVESLCFTKPKGENGD